MLLRVLVFWFVGIFISAIYGDTIYLHDGSSILGEIVESIPNVSYALEKQDGTIQVFKMDEVWKVSFEERGIYEDRFYLKDGGVVTGEIIGSMPGETYKIKLQDKSILVYNMDEVLKIEFGKKAKEVVKKETPPQQPVPPPSLEPQVPKGKISRKIGLCLIYPGLGLKIGLFPNFLLEARGQFAKDISVYGARGQYYFNPKAKISYFAGIEGDLISFKEGVAEGNGYCFVGFLGGEYFLFNIFSFQLDFGPVYVSIKDKATNLSEKGFDYLINIGLNLYIK